MASLRKYPRSPYWFACFTAPDGKRVQRSTKHKLRKPAQTMADEWETLAKEKARARQSHKVIAEIYKAAHGEELPMSDTRAYLQRWLATRAGSVKPATLTAYKARIKSFTTFMGSAADKEPIGNCTVELITRYRDEIAAKRSAATANQAVKILRVIFEDARRDGFLSDNPAKDVRALKKAQREAAARRPFTVDELKTVLKVADSEWRSMILFGLYTGQRLADIAQFQWSNLDIETGELKLSSGKTGRTIIIPLCKPLQDHVSTLTAGDDTTAPIHPRAAAHIAASGRPVTLSRQFGELLAAAGLRPATSHQAKQDKQARRVANQLCFHALRHTATSLMKNAGISPAVVQDIIGHDSKEMSDHYTTIESAAKRTALESLPDLTK